MFGKSSGTGGGGASTIYDATPLSLLEDSKLVVDRLIEKLLPESPFPSERVAIIESRKGLKPMVHELAIAEVERLGFDKKLAAKTALGILQFEDIPAVELSRANRMIEELHRLEPNSLRSRALLGLVQYRSGKSADALKTLGDQPAMEDDSLPGYELLYRSVELLAGDQTFTQEAIDSFRSMQYKVIEKRGGTEFLRIALEVNRRFPRPSVDAFIASGRSRSADRQIESFKQFDKNHDERVTIDELLESGGPLWQSLQPYDRDQDGGISFAEYLAWFRVPELVREAAVNLTKSPADSLKMLDEAIELRADEASALNARAWIRATASDKSLRDIKQALIDAERASELTKRVNAEYLGTLAIDLSENER